jgi:hypothetical protein
MHLASQSLRCEVGRNTISAAKYCSGGAIICAQHIHVGSFGAQIRHAVSTPEVGRFRRDPLASSARVKEA